MDSKQEKVIKGLESFKDDLKPFAGNSADWKKVDDAIDLLKAQAPHDARLLTADEVQHLQDRQTNLHRTVGITLYWQTWICYWLRMGRYVQQE